MREKYYLSSLFGRYLQIMSVHLFFLLLESDTIVLSIRAAFSDRFEGKSWYVLKINNEPKVSFNKMLLIIDKYY